MCKVKFGCSENKVEKVMDMIKSTLKNDAEVTFTSDYFFYYAVLELKGSSDYSSTLEKLTDILSYLQKKNLIDFFFIDNKDNDLMKAMC